ncbi:basal body-orientation factor 1-like [Halichondria panicea]|uniref:basal body-orientation factor 1-like n=1 Tax=Halichondria panicea TaxID=6063 RepID=UPI00312BBB0C
MPKKKKEKGGKKKGKGKGEVKEKGEDTDKPFEAPGVSEKEKILKKELAELDFELDTLKRQVSDLRSENDWLQREADKSKDESQDYQTYISRKAQKRQTMIVSLNDHNQHELREIQEQREKVIDKYTEEKKALNVQLLRKEEELEVKKDELQALAYFKTLKEEQDEEIMSLERRLETLRFQHEDRVRGMKTKFLKEKKAYEDSIETRIKSMAVEASKEVTEHLKEHTSYIKTENHRLRKELQDLIETTNSLQLQKKKLEKQYQKLLHEYQYNQGIQQLRGSVFRNNSTA